MRKHILAAVQAHTAADYPRECCGLIITVGRSHRYIPCHNTATDPAEEFPILPEHFATFEDQGEVIGIVHSHRMPPASRHRVTWPCARPQGCPGISCRG